MAPMMLYFRNIYSARHLKIAAVAAAAAGVATSSEIQAIVLYIRANIAMHAELWLYIYSAHTSLVCAIFI